MIIEKIYFDMDGVLADFDEGLFEMCGIAPKSQETRTEMETAKLWSEIRKIDHFYNKLGTIPGSKEMFDAIYKKYGSKCEILSAIPNPKRNICTAEEDKREWVKREISDSVKVNIVLRKEKSKYADSKGCILIDDFKSNIEEWEALGGYGILFTSAKDVLREIEKFEQQLSVTVNLQ